MSIVMEGNLTKSTCFYQTFNLLLNLHPNLAKMSIIVISKRRHPASIAFLASSF
uniref:Uncharacterized protein n=1 Tax=Arundo donax TaxID=35708 RepID=A0A0A8XYB9_ARUDO